MRNRKQITCNCEAYAFPHRFDPQGYCMDFLPQAQEKFNYEHDGDVYEEMMLDAKHRAADINVVK